MQITVWPRGTGRTIYSGPRGIPWDGHALAVGTPLPSSALGKLTDIKYSTRYEDGFGGEDLAEWTFLPHGGYIGGLFRPGDHVKITKGGGTCFEGEYSEAAPAGDGKVTLKAKGYAYNPYDYDSLYVKEGVGDDRGYPTNRLVGAGGSSWYGWEYATEILGMPISQVIGTIPTGAYGTAESAMVEAPVKIGQVLTERCREQGLRWSVWGRTLVIAADPTTPMWKYNAPDTVVGIADTEFATHVGIWYIADYPNGILGAWDETVTYTNAATQKVEYAGGTWKSLLNGNLDHPPDEESSVWWESIPTVRAPWQFRISWAIDDIGLARFDARTAVADYRGLGVIDSVRAQELADNLLGMVKGRFTLSGSFQVTPQSGFTTINDGLVDLAFVKAGTMMRLNGLRTSQGNLMPDGNDFIIGQTEYTWAAPAGPGQDAVETLTVTPMGAVPRNVADIMRGVPGGDTSLVSLGAPIQR